MSIFIVLSLMFSDRLIAVTKDIVGMLPNYWRHVAASSSGKYHPAFTLGEGGLVRHSVVVAYFAHRLSMAWGLSDYEHDVVVAAALLHDGLKQGDGGHTVHEHPLLMARWLRSLNVGDLKNAMFIEAIASVVETHMGFFTTSKYSDVVLPTPITKLQLLLSAADMLAATKELDFNFDRMVESIKEEVAKRTEW